MPEAKPAQPVENLLVVFRIHIWGHLGSTRAHPPGDLPLPTAAPASSSPSKAATASEGHKP